MHIILPCKKLGMTQKIEGDRRKVVTILQPIEAKVTEINRYSKGFNVKVAYGPCNEKKINKPIKGYLEKYNLPNYRYFKEFTISSSESFKSGDSLTLQESYLGSKIKITSKSRGHGFTGVMKRYNFTGLGASHGVSGKHRSGGSIGNCAAPARVFPGKKMPGRHGNKNITLRTNIEYVDMEQNLLVVNGIVSGKAGVIVFVKSYV